jgi:hypothetical protein
MIKRVIRICHSGRSNQPFNAWFHEIKDLGGTEEVNAVTVAMV